jgi:hypothetical protein
MSYKGWRPFKTHGFMTQPAEPGCADYAFIAYLQDGVSLILWVEFKRPGDKRRCYCRPGERKICSVCRQVKWAADERRRGGEVWEGIKDLSDFEARYKQRYGWLQPSDFAKPRF